VPRRTGASKGGSGIFRPRAKNLPVPTLRVAFDPPACPVPFLNLSGRGTPNGFDARSPAAGVEQGTTIHMGNGEHVNCSHDAGTRMLVRIEQKRGQSKLID
jgi:hypothetical protein